MVRTLMNSLQLVFDAEKTLRYIIFENIYHVWKHSSVNFATNLMNRARAAKTTILLITTLVLTVITSIQPVFAPNTCGRFIAQFEKLIESFMSDTLRLIPPDLISPFVKLTIPFDKDVTKAAYAGHASSPDDPLIPNLVRKYQYEVFHTLLPDQIFPILQTYELEVLKIFFRH